MLDKAFAAMQIRRLSGHSRFHYLTDTAQEELVEALVRGCVSDQHAERTLTYWLQCNGRADELPMPVDLIEAAAEVAPPSAPPGPCERCHSTRYESCSFLITYATTQSGTRS